MRKLVFVSTLYPQTHYSRYLLSSMQKMAKNYDLEVLVYSEKGQNIEGHGLSNVKQVFDQKPYFFLQIIANVLKDKPDIVHLQHEASMYGGISTVGLFPLLVLLLRILGKKVVITLHAVVSREQIDDDFLRTFSFPPILPIIYATKGFFTYLYWTSSLLANEIVVHSIYMKNILCSNYLVMEKKVTVIPIGIQNVKSYTGGVKRFLPESIYNRISRKKIILFFGYIIKRKGLEYLIEAIDLLRNNVGDFVLVLAGGTIPYQKDYPVELRRIVYERELADYVIFTSFLSEDQINELFHLSRLVVLPYVYSISSSLPLSFALQYDKPVVATEIGTLKEEVSDLDCGLLVPPKDSLMLMESINMLLSDDRCLEEKISNIKDSKVRRTWDVMADKTAEVYSKN